MAAHEPPTLAEALSAGLDPKRAADCHEGPLRIHRGRELDSVDVPTRALEPLLGQPHELGLVRESCPFHPEQRLATRARERLHHRSPSLGAQLAPRDSEET